MMDPADLTAELLRLKNRFERIFNDVLCDMKPGWDDSIEGFNKAWDIAREIFDEEIGRAAIRALKEPVQPRADDGNSYRYHATGLPAGGDKEQP